MKNKKQQNNLRPLTQVEDVVGRIHLSDAELGAVIGARSASICIHEVSNSIICVIEVKKFLKSNR